MASPTSSSGRKEDVPHVGSNKVAQGNDKSSKRLSPASASGSRDSECVWKDSGQARLEELGYRQELRREFGLWSSTAAGFAVMSYILGIIGGLPLSYINGGPVSAVWGWIIVSLGNVLVGLSVAELASSFPLAGGPYFWVVELTGADPKWGLLAWVTGWLNVLGQFAATSSAAFVVSGLTDDIWGMVHDGDDLTRQELLLVYSITLLLAGGASSMTTKGVQQFTLFAAGFSAVASTLIIIVLLAVSRTKQSAEFVFLTFHGDGHPNTQIDSGSPSDFYTFLLGTLCAHFTFVGLETPAQFAEETKRADRTVPWAIMFSIIGTSVLGLGFLICILFCIEPDLVLKGIVDGNIVGQVFYNAFKTRFGSGEGGIVLLSVPLLAVFTTTVMCMVTNARMLWSFSRDGGVPLYQAWGAIEEKTGTPLCATWAMTALAFLIGLPLLHSDTAFDAVGSISALGLYISCAIPIALRLFKPKSFTPGPFALGKAHQAVNILSLLWITFSVGIFVMPDFQPINLWTLNYAPITLGIVLIVLLSAWFLPKFGVGRWYRPKAHILHNAQVRGGERYVEESALRERYTSIGSGPPGKLTLARFAAAVSRTVQARSDVDRPKQRVRLAFSSEVIGSNGPKRNGTKRGRAGAHHVGMMPGIPDTKEEGTWQDAEEGDTGTPRDNTPEGVERRRSLGQGHTLCSDPQTPRSGRGTRSSSL